MIALSFSGQIDVSVIDLDQQAKDQSGIGDDLSRYASFEEYIQSKEKIILEWALTQCDNSVTDAAKLLNIPRTTLSSKIARLFPSK
jgi:transcriptional regulator with PAS, ATPase and Fis domain